MKKHVNPAHAGRTFDALRGLGYDFNSSVADLIDNSITPRVGSSEVNIIFRKEFNKFKNQDCFVLKIIDNGSGMDNEELWNAMTLGADVDESYTKSDLSRYGFGMKTASLAHCQILSVISKKNGKVSGYRWDLNKLVGKKNWEMFELDNLEINDVIEHTDIDLSDTWTLVLWNDLFQIEKDYNSYKSNVASENYYFNMIAELKMHLGMVFHRFLDGTVNSPISIFINKTKIDPWDPFLRKEDFTTEIKFKNENGRFRFSDNEDPLIIRGFVMPNQDQFSSMDAWKNGKGLGTWNDSQGYYIYREDRIIRYGGYHGIRGKDEHDKLARISIDLKRSMDKEFKLTVSKNRIQFPVELRHHLKDNINKYVTGPARKRYDKKYENEKHIVKNRIRNDKTKKIDQLALKLMEENKVTTVTSFLDKNKVTVKNPSGNFASNNLMDYFDISERTGFEVVSDNLESNVLWKVLCSDKNKFKVVVNSGHPFYELIYKNNNPRKVTEAVDALIFALAFSELKIKNKSNEYMMNDFKFSCSTALKEFIKTNIVD